LSEAKSNILQLTRRMLVESVSVGWDACGGMQTQMMLGETLGNSEILRCRCRCRYRYRYRKSLHESPPRHWLQL